jgi:hypothetical protein
MKMRETKGGQPKAVQTPQKVLTFCSVIGSLSACAFLFAFGSPWPNGSRQRFSSGVASAPGPAPACRRWLALPVAPPCATPSAPARWRWPRPPRGPSALALPPPAIGSGFSLRQRQKSGRRFLAVTPPAGGSFERLFRRRRSCSGRHLVPAGTRFRPCGQQERRKGEEQVFTVSALRENSSYLSRYKVL